MTPDINKILALPCNNAADAYGSSMGRRDQREGTPERLHLQRLRFVDGDYDTGGAYWGGGSKDGAIYCAFSPEDTNNDVPIMVFVRARNREEAKSKVLERLPGEGWSFAANRRDTVTVSEESPTIGYVDDYGFVTYAQVRQAMDGKPYLFKAVGYEKHPVILALKQGINSHLEACFIEGKDTYTLTTAGVEASVSPDSLPVLLRRLIELGILADEGLLDNAIAEAGESFAAAIIYSLLSPSAR